MRAGLQSISKLDFLEIYPYICAKAFNNAITVRNSFAVSGLVPLDPDRVLEKLDVQLLSVPTTPTSRGGEWQPHIPVKPSDVQQQLASINRSFEKGSYSPPSSVERALIQIGKGAERAMHDVAMVTEQVKRLQDELNTKRQRHENRGRRLPYEGGMTAEQALERLQARRAARNGNRGVGAAGNAEDEMVTQRPRQRCTNCREVGHKRNRCPQAISNQQIE